MIFAITLLSCLAWASEHSTPPQDDVLAMLSQGDQFDILLDIAGLITEFEENRLQGSFHAGSMSHSLEHLARRLRGCEDQRIGVHTWADRSDTISTSEVSAYLSQQGFANVFDLQQVDNVEGRDDIPTTSGESDQPCRPECARGHGNGSQGGNEQGHHGHGDGHGHHDHHQHGHGHHDDHHGHHDSHHGHHDSHHGHHGHGEHEHGHGEPNGRGSHGEAYGHHENQGRVWGREDSSSSDSQFSQGVHGFVISLGVILSIACVAFAIYRACFKKAGVVVIEGEPITGELGSYETKNPGNIQTIEGSWAVQVTGGEGMTSIEGEEPAQKQMYE